MLGMQYLSSYMVMLIAAIRPAWFQTYQSMMEGIGFGDMTPLLAVYTVLIAPISEELIFRGVTLKYASRAMPFFMANIFQSVLFGYLYHIAIRSRDIVSHTDTLTVYFYLFHMHFSPFICLIYSCYSLSRYETGTFFVSHTPFFER